MAKLENIILHCSDSGHGSAAEIRRWHLSNGWRDIGYHLVVPNGYTRPDFYIPQLDGSLEIGRYLDGDGFITGNEVGAHTLGYNDSSIGICMIGVKKFTVKQFWKVKETIEFLILHYGLKVSDVYGHYEKQKGRSCPNVDMVWFRETLFRSSIHHPDSMPYNLEKYWLKSA